MRSTLTGLGELLRLEPELLDDLKTATSEACNNVVLHAYGGDPGPLELSLSLSAEDLELTVRDRGVGIQRFSPAAERMGVGLAVISALARRAEFHSEPGDGTEVRMSFATDGVGALDELVARGAIGPAAPPVELHGTIVVNVAPADLLVELMGRLVRAVAAGAHFSVDRFPSLRAVTAALGVRAAELDGNGRVAFAIDGRARRVELQVAPLPPGSARELFTGRSPAGADGMIERVDGEPLDGRELVRVVVVEPRR